MNQATKKTASPLALVGLLVAGCGATATVQRRSGPAYEARIVRSDPTGLYLEPPPGQTALLRVEGADIVDIDHPGNVTMTVGAVLLGIWGSLLTDQGFRDELFNGGGSRGDVYRASLPLTLIYGVPGALMTAFGAYRYSSSIRAAAAFEDARWTFPPPLSPGFAPLVTPAAVPAAGTAASPVAPGTPAAPAAPTSPAPPTAPPTPEPPAPVR